MEGKTKAEKLHDVYVYCKENFEPSNTFFDEEASLENENEKRFFRAINDFFLQEKQREYLKNR